MTKFNNSINSIKKDIEKYQFILGALILMFSIIFSYNYINYGLDFTDSFFYINSIKDAKNFPLWIGTTAIGKFTAYSIGSDLIHFRFVNWMSYILAAVLPFFSLIPLSKLKNNLHVLAITIFCLNLLSFNVFGIDGLSILFVSINSIFILRYFKNRQFTDLLFTSLFSAIVIAVRLPSIIIVPIFIVLNGVNIYFKKPDKTFSLIFLKSTFLYIILTIVILTFFYLLTFQRLNFIDDIVKSFKTSSNQSYSLNEIFRNYLLGFIKLIEYVGFVFMILAVSNFSYYKVLGKFRYVIQIGLLAIVLIYLKYALYIDWYLFKPSHFISAISIVTICYLILSDIKKHNTSNISELLLISLVNLTLIFGTNTGLLKLAPILLIFASLYFVIYEIKLSSFNKVLVSIITLFMILLKPISIYEDAPRKTLTARSSISKLSDIYTSPQRVNFLNDVMKNYNLSLHNNNIVFWGRRSHIFHYITSTSTNYKNSFWMLPDDSLEIKKAKKMIEISRPIIFFTPSYPDSENENKNTQLLPFEIMILSLNYKEESHRYYKIFKPL